MSSAAPAPAPAPAPKKTSPADHTVAEGETLPVIAAAYGFQDWPKVFNDGGNAALRKTRPHPAAVQKGDKVHIPEKQPKEAKCDLMKTHKFRLKAQPTLLSLVLKDDEGIAYASKSYALSVDGKMLDGKTDEQGGLSCAVPAKALKGELRIWLSDDPKEPPVSFALELGKMPPLEETAGVQARLNLLGYPAGPATGSMNEATRAALLAFQSDHVDGYASGEPDGATLAALAKAVEAAQKTEKADAAGAAGKKA